MNGWKVILTLAFGLAIQTASGRGLISPDMAKAVDAGALSDAAVQVYISGAFLVGTILRLFSTKPGALAPKKLPARLQRPSRRVRIGFRVRSCRRKRTKKSNR